MLGLNLVSANAYGELEFWFALIKVVAAVTFLVVGIYFVLFGPQSLGRRSDSA